MHVLQQYDPTCCCQELEEDKYNVKRAEEAKSV